MYQVLPQCTLNYHSVPWTTTTTEVNLVLPQCTLYYQIVPWTTTAYLILPQCTLYYHSVPSTTTVYLVLPQCTLNYHRVPCTTKVYPVPQLTDSTLSYTQYPTLQTVPHLTGKVPHLTNGFPPYRQYPTLHTVPHLTESTPHTNRPFPPFTTSEVQIKNTKSNIALRHYTKSYISTPSYFIITCKHLFQLSLVLFFTSSLLCPL